MILCYIFFIKGRGWIMEKREKEADLLNLLRLVLALWLGYLPVLFVIDHALSPRPVFRVPFYLVNGLDALLMFGLVLWPRCRKVLGAVFLPLIIVLLAVVPVVTGNLVVLRMPPSPAGNAEAIMLRLLPMNFMPLVVTAWRYQWKHVVIFILAMSAFNVGLHGMYYRPGGAPFTPPLLAFVIQMVSFFLVGYFISTLMRRLREQNVSLEQANAQLVHYAGTLEHLAVSRERNRLARELHDTLAHTLSALSVQLEAAKAYFDVDLGTARELMEKSLQATRSGLIETRGALRALRANPLDDLGLLLALRQMAEESTANAKLQLHLSLPDQLESLSPDVEQTLYRVAQETVANVVQHAGARNLTLKLLVEEDVLMLVVSDDGIGFRVEDKEAMGHFGLVGLRERAQLMGGRLAIESRPGQGTTIKLAIGGEGHEGRYLR